MLTSQKPQPLEFLSGILITKQALSLLYNIIILLRYDQAISLFVLYEPSNTGNMIWIGKRHLGLRDNEF